MKCKRRLLTKTEKETLKYIYIKEEEEENKQTKK